MENRVCEMEKGSWKSFCKIIKNISPAFAKIVDEIDPGNSYNLYRIKYPYGAIVLDKGIFQLPNSDGRLVPISHSSISNKLKDDLSYSGTIPLGLVTSNGFESFVQTKSRILPSALMATGRFLSLWRVTEEGYSYYVGPFWNYSAGARSICMLPKVTDSASYKNLKSKYNLKLPIPQNLTEHWNLFTEIANHPSFSQPWSAEIIFFSKQWFEHKTDKHWTNFYRYLLNEVWQTSAYRRNQFIFDSAFSIAQENRNLRPNPYLSDTVKHLIAIGSGAYPGFSTGINDLAAPISGLQKTYIEDYGLKKYAPVIMHTHHFSLTENRPAYYSFQMPTTTVFSPKSRKLSSTMVEIHELKHIMETLMSEILKGHLGVEQTPLYDLAKNTRYGYYHSDKEKAGKDRASEILPITEISNLDNSFVKSLIDNISYTFPEFAPFFRGCVAISGAT